MGAAAPAVPAVGPWGVLLLGCLLGIFAVLYLRSARKVGLGVSLLMPLIPISAFAGLPFTFANGTVADALQVNANLNSLTPVVGKSAAR
ncbi:MAG: IPTL-CTERM sorting domain-containing protein [Pseudomonadota bacterium]